MFGFTFFRNPRNNSVHLRLTNNRKKAEMELGISATEDEFEDAQSAKPKSKNTILSCALRDIATILRRYQCELLQDGKDGGDVKELRDAVKSMIFHQALVEKLDKKPKIDESKLFGRFYQKCTNAKANKGYQDSCNYTLKKIKAFCADEDTDFCKDYNELVFEDISLKWLNAFDQWLVKQGAAQNSRNIHFKNIRTVINRAIDEELTDKYPFRRFKIRPEETRKRSLSVDDLRKLFDYSCEEYQQYYIDMFKLVFMLVGINAVDLYNLERIENGRIEYRRAKTHRLYSIKVEPEAMEIINKYKGEKKLLSIADRWKDHKDFTKNINIALKKIGELKIVGRGGKKEITPEWPELSLYYARHTWATIAYNHCDVSKDVISQALGHKMGVGVTEIYLNKDQKKVDAANRKVIDFVLYGDASED